MIKEHGATRVRFVATSATRDARNRRDFVDGIRELLGVEPEVISGDEEAALSFAGASSVLPSGARTPSWWWTSAAAAPNSCWATPTASSPQVRGHWLCAAHRTHLRSEPPTAAQIAAAEADVDAALDLRPDVPLDRARPSSAWPVPSPPSPPTRCACGILRPRPSTALTGHGNHRRACTDLLEMTRDERAALPYMHPGRVDVIGAGALVWRRILERLAGPRGQSARRSPANTIFLTECPELS